MEQIHDDSAEMEKLRKKFVYDFNRHIIETMSIKDYAMGSGEKDNYCYRLERELKRLGNITGSQIQNLEFGLVKMKNSINIQKSWEII